jgi:hypothetical protein
MINVSPGVSAFAKFRQRSYVGFFNFSIHCSLVSNVPISFVQECFEGFMEEHMKSLSDLADSYDAWAKVAETASEETLACLDTFAIDVQADQRWRASLLAAEAVELRARAEELRTLELRRSIRYVPYRRSNIGFRGTER